MRQAQEERCRSHDLIRHSDDGPVLRDLPKSAPPEVGHGRGGHGYAVPPYPTSTEFRPYGPGAEDDDSSGGSSTASTIACHPNYRLHNLVSNQIHLHQAFGVLPLNLPRKVGATSVRRGSPDISNDDMKEVMFQLGEQVQVRLKRQVANFLNDAILPNPQTDPTFGPRVGLASSSGALMSPHLVPHIPDSPYRISHPKPDKLYGYSCKAGVHFTEPQLWAQTMLHPGIVDYSSATLQGLRFPFLAIEFKAACRTGGSTWVATNKCAGSSAACLSAIDRVNCLLWGHDMWVDNFTYSLALDTNVALLYVSWKSDPITYHTKLIDSFLLSSAIHVQALRSRVRNIIEWGMDTRLKQLRLALDIILEDNMKQAAELAKCRPSSPSERSAKSGGPGDDGDPGAVRVDSGAVGGDSAAIGDGGELLSSLKKKIEGRAWSGITLLNC